MTGESEGVVRVGADLVDISRAHTSVRANDVDRMGEVRAGKGGRPTVERGATSEVRRGR